MDFTELAGLLAIDLPTGCNLPPGTYWLMVQADMDYIPFGQWYWGGRSVQSNGAFVWQNPADGWERGCTTWTIGTSCLWTDPDLLFTLRGHTAP